MRRYVVVAPLALLTVGDRFTSSDWPLHVTVVPTFFTDAPVGDLSSAVEDAASAIPPFGVVIGADALFGPRHTVPVSEVVMDDPLRAVHAGLVEGLGRCGIVLETPEYAGAGFRAHVTHTKRRRVAPGDVADLTQVVLVDMNPGQDRGMLAVLAVSGLRSP